MRTRVFLVLALSYRAVAQLPPGPFTADQSAAGKTAYQTNCSSCHAADLGGRNEAPPLAGANFMTAWGTRTVGDLVTYMPVSYTHLTLPTNREV